MTTCHLEKQAYREGVGETHTNYMKKNPSLLLLLNIRTCQGQQMYQEQKKPQKHSNLKELDQDTQGKKKIPDATDNLTEEGLK